jgi:hypothetical protein
MKNLEKQLFEISYSLSHLRQTKKRPKQVSKRILKIVDLITLKKQVKSMQPYMFPHRIEYVVQSSKKGLNLSLMRQTKYQRHLHFAFGISRNIHHS